MGRLHQSPNRDHASTRRGGDELFDVDVLVIGGGAAGTQAAVAAAALGASVLVVDRAWPEHAAPAWPESVGSPGDEPPQRRSVAQRRGRWLLGHTALELLLDDDGEVHGARGVWGSDEHPWCAHAGAVLLTTGAPAQAPDALLLAAEAGAALALAMPRHLGISTGLPALQVLDLAGNTAVNGLQVAGDAASPHSGIDHGLPAATHALAMLSGQRAGVAAADLARHRRPPSQRLLVAGRVGLAGAGHHAIDPRATRAALQALLASAAQCDDSASLQAASARLDALWRFLSATAAAPAGLQRVTREAVGAVAAARWQLACWRADAARAAVGGAGPLVCGGLTSVWARPAVRPLRPAAAPDHAAVLAGDGDGRGEHEPGGGAMHGRRWSFAR